MALSKSNLKYIRSLKEKKWRNEHRVFVAEGNKMVSDLLPCLKCQKLFATEGFFASIQIDNVEECFEVTESELSQASFLKTPQQALAIFYQSQLKTECNIANELTLVLDGIQDPGNMGTIVRLADWYGIRNIYCSQDTVDIYNPKTVQATMGALARVMVHYVDLADFLESNKHLPIYGTLLDGDNMYEQEITDNGIIVMGNEGNGISPETLQFINRRLYIPNYPLGKPTSESLNVAIATAIVCSEFRRRATS